jgi:hypothetical protein
MSFWWLLPSPADFLVQYIAKRWRAFRKEKLVKEARSWPQAHGIILGGRANRVEDAQDSFSSWNAELTYSYVVDGEYYSGQGLLPRETEDEVQEQLRAWKGRKVIVRYSPIEPAKSVLLRDQRNG